MAITICDRRLEYSERRSQIVIAAQIIPNGTNYFFSLLGKAYPNGTSLPPSNPNHSQAFPKKQKLQQVQSEAAYARHEAKPPQVPLRSTLAGTVGFPRAGV